MTHQDPTALPTATDAASLLAQASTQWQTGDWHSLAKLQRDTLQHHPDRAHLALLAAAGRLQMGKDAEAKPFICLAQEWGASKHHIGQMLITGVHRSLGRAAELGNQKQRAQRHFESAAAIGTGWSIDKQVIAPPSPRLPKKNQSFEVLADTLQQQKIELDAQLKRQSDELIRVRKFLDSTVQREVANATKQIEAAIGLQNYFATGELPHINTERHSWPISPDFALYLIELLELNDYDLIIEFGSGISTSIIAKTLAKMAVKRSGKPPVDFVSFDHLEKYYQQTLAQLEHAGLAETVQLNLAPLQDWLAPNGNTYPYYACQPTLAALAKKHPAAGLRLLVIVDGPPAATGKHARYPAGPLILQHFAGAHIDLLLDDYIRDDEREVAKLWQADVVAAKLSYTTSERKLEKDACLMAVSNLKENA